METMDLKGASQRFRTLIGDSGRDRYLLNQPLSPWRISNFENFNRTSFFDKWVDETVCTV